MNDPDVAELIRFKPSEELEKAKRTMLVYLAVVAIIEFAEVSFDSISLSTVSAKIGNPIAITIALWGMFIYSFSMYLLKGNREVRWHRLETQLLRNRVIVHYAYIEWIGTIYQDIEDVTAIGGGQAAFYRAGDRIKLRGVSSVARDPTAPKNKERDPIEFEWTVSREATKVADNALKILRVALTYEFFAYRFPVWVAILVMEWGLFDLLYEHFPWSLPLARP